MIFCTLGVFWRARVGSHEFGCIPRWCWEPSVWCVPGDIEQWIGVILVTHDANRIRILFDSRHHVVIE